MTWNFGKNTENFSRIMLGGKPFAYASVYGSKKYPLIRGSVYFYRAQGGLLITASFSGLPQDEGRCSARVFGFHIHSGASCTGNEEDEFFDTNGHFNPENCPHPKHIGDLPPVFGFAGFGWFAFYSGALKPDDIIGRTVVLHEGPDDFTSQPAGNSGTKIACGNIVKLENRQSDV